MKSLRIWMAGAATAGAMAVMLAAPASAQYYDYRYDRDRDVVEEVVDGVARVAGAVAAVTQGYYPGYGYSRYGYGYNQGGERFAADACAYEAQRRYARRYGGVGVNVSDVRWYRSNRLRVYGTLELPDYYGSNRYSRSYDRFGRFDRRLGFTCSVRPDGWVTDFDTHRYY
jgi:hypothetical protein